MIQLFELIGHFMFELQHELKSNYYNEFFQTINNKQPKTQNCMVNIFKFCLEIQPNLIYIVAGADPRFQFGGGGGGK